MLCAGSRLGSFVLGVMTTGRLLIYISKPFVICAGSTSYFNRERENKNIDQRKTAKFPNHLISITMTEVAGRQKLTYNIYLVFKWQYLKETEINEKLNK